MNSYIRRGKSVYALRTCKSTVSILNQGTLLAKIFWDSFGEVHQNWNTGEGDDLEMPIEQSIKGETYVRADVTFRCTRLPGTLKVKIRTRDWPRKTPDNLTQCGILPSLCFKYITWKLSGHRFLEMATLIWIGIQGAVHSYFISFSSIFLTYFLHCKKKNTTEQDACEMRFNSSVQICYS